MSFVKNAPEIAEEILLKAAELPEGLRSFSRSLLEKQAVDTREKLQLPPRMTLADLQKMAHSNEVDLPKVACGKSDDFADVAGQLRKVAERRDEELSQEIFQDAAALVAAKHEKAAKITLPADSASFAQRMHAKFISNKSPLSLAVQTQEAEGQAALSLARAKIHGSHEHTAARDVAKSEAHSKNEAAAAKSHAKLVTHGIGAIPAVATGVGAAVAGAAALKPGDKKEFKAERIIA